MTAAARPLATLRARRVRCDLCPKACTLAPGERGDCRIRANLDGELRALTFGLPSAVHVDPIEKKPLFHFRPGGRILSIATAGCNLHCRNCQNWTLSQSNPEDLDNRALPPDRVVALARSESLDLLAYTYAEPLVFYEYTHESFAAARAAGIETVLVSAGFANAAPLRRLYRATSAATIDVKAFDDRFYREVCDGALQPVLDGLVVAKEEGVWLEVSHLVIPTLNDDPAKLRALARWMVRSLGADTPLHLLRFTPRYRLQNLPPTPEETLSRFADAARGEGLRYVYVGNVLGSSHQTTHCPTCRLALVEREGYRLGAVRVQAGACPRCGTAIAGRWT